MNEAYQIYKELISLGIRVRTERGKLRLSGEIRQVSSLLFEGIRRHHYDLVILLSAMQDSARRAAFGTSYRLAPRDVEWRDRRNFCRPRPRESAPADDTSGAEARSPYAPSETAAA